MSGPNCDRFPKIFFESLEQAIQVTEKNVWDRAQFGPDIQAFLDLINQISKKIRDDVREVVVEGQQQLELWREMVATSNWKTELDTAKADAEAYLEELKAKGIDPRSYNQLKDE